jgi:hypothetical protein
MTLGAENTSLHCVQNILTGLCHSQHEGAEIVVVVPSFINLHREINCHRHYNSSLNQTSTCRIVRTLYH